MWPGITRISLVCLRFDDYHQDVDNETWVDVLSRYDDHGLRGVIGVIPKYQDELLSGDVVPFLHELRENGWELAQHGYTHEDIGEGRGGYLYDERSEFCGVPLAEQRRRIGAGRDILESHGIEPTTFIPPWHEYDRNTARALAEHGFDCINEGRCPVPRTVEGVTLVPTHPPSVTPYTFSVGVVTLVSHPQFEDDPMRNADAVLGRSARVRTPSEIVSWWRNRSMIGSLIDAFERLAGPLSCVHIANK
jgi:peptidoglycan/xylan/chitin deacetylase (PgdA/CDA1 family)